MRSRPTKHNVSYGAYRSGRFDDLPTVPKGYCAKIDLPLETRISEVTSRTPRVTLIKLLKECRVKMGWYERRLKDAKAD